jgi:hypothetical protein
MGNRQIDNSAAPGTPAAVGGPTSEELGVGTAVQAIIDSLVSGAVGGADILATLATEELVGVGLAEGLAAAGLAVTAIGVAGSAGLLIVGVGALISPTLRTQLAGVAKMLSVVTSPAGTAVLVSKLASGASEADAMQAADRAVAIEAGANMLLGAAKGINSEAKAASFLDNVDKVNDYAEEHPQEVSGGADALGEFPGGSTSDGTSSSDDPPAVPPELLKALRQIHEGTYTIRLTTKADTQEAQTDSGDDSTTDPTAMPSQEDIGSGEIEGGGDDEWDDDDWGDD